MPTVTDVFAEINNRLESDPAKAAGISAIYAFDLNGEPYHITLADGKGEAGPGAPENPNITITMAPDDFIDLATGKLDGTRAFMSGKLKIKGEMALAMKLQSVLK